MDYEVLLLSKTDSSSDSVINLYPNDQRQLLDQQLNMTTEPLRLGSEKAKRY